MELLQESLTVVRTSRDAFAGLCIHLFFFGWSFHLAPFVFAQVVSETLATELYMYGRRVAVQ